MMMFLPEGMRGGAGVTASLTAGAAGATSVPLEISVSSGTLLDWDLDKSEDGGATWSTVEDGITTTSKTASNLNPATSVQFRGTARVEVEAVGMVSVATTELPAIALTSWAQIDGGDDLGDNIAGGGIWFWNNSGPCTFEAIVRNREDVVIDAIQIPVETTSDTPGAMLGFGVKRTNWQLDTTEIVPPAGTWDSPGITLSSVMELTEQIPATVGEIYFQQELGPGNQTPGKNFDDKFHPETGNTTYAGMEVGSHLGTDLDRSGVSIGPFPPKMYMRMVGKTIYSIGLFGDSTVGMVQPVESSTALSKEGVWFWANENMRAAGKRVRAYSYGQGTAQWESIKARVRAHLPTMVGKVSRVCVQVWTWNTAWSSAELAEAAWLEYLALEEEVKAAGFACSPLILHPYTTRNDAGQIAAFGALKAHVQAHPEGLWLDEITGSTSWPNLPSAESEDNVHQNQSGSKRCASDVAAKLLVLAAIDYPELA